MTERRHAARLVLAATVLAAGLLAHPVRAGDTRKELQNAKSRLSRIEQEATAATAEYEAALGRLITTRQEIQETRERIAEVETRVGKIKRRLGERAREAYLMGGFGVLDLLFTSSDVTDFSDRVVFLDRLAQEDSDLALRANVLAEELGRERADLGNLAARQLQTIEVLEKKREEIYDKLAEAEALRDELEEKLAAEIAAARRVAQQQAASRSAPPASGDPPSSAPVVSGGALQACPVPGSSFVDSWGAPRSGGRTHQGVDMMASSGTPVYAATAGQVSHSSSDLGGIQAHVYAPNGDMTFYAHLSGYAGGPRSVSAGEQIGYVGDTGNAQGSPHLHFEYHPGGGGAVNPYPYVAAVC